MSWLSPIARLILLTFSLNTHRSITVCSFEGGGIHLTSLLIYPQFHVFDPSKHLSRLWTTEETRPTSLGIDLTVLGGKISLIGNTPPTLTTLSGDSVPLSLFRLHYIGFYQSVHISFGGSILFWLLNWPSGFHHIKSSSLALQLNSTNSLEESTSFSAAHVRQSKGQFWGSEPQHTI